MLPENLTVLTVLALVALIGLGHHLYSKWKAQREHLSYLKKHFPWHMGSPTVDSCGEDFEAMLRRLATGAYYEPQMTREEVLRVIECHGWEKVMAFNRERPALPISYMAF